MVATLVIAIDLEKIKQDGVLSIHDNKQTICRKKSDERKKSSSISMWRN